MNTPAAYAAANAAVSAATRPATDPNARNATFAAAAVGGVEDAINVAVDGVTRIEVDVAGAAYAATNAAFYDVADAATKDA